MIPITRLLLAFALTSPLFSQHVSYSLYTVPLIGSPKQFSEGVTNVLPEKLIFKTKNNSPQMFVPLNDRFSISVYLYNRKQLDSIHIGFDDKNTDALGTNFYVREAGDIFREFGKPGAPRIRVQTKKILDLEQPVTIEFVDSISIELDSDVSFLRSVISIIPGINRYNYLLKIKAGSKIAFVALDRHR